MYLWKASVALRNIRKAKNLALFLIKLYSLFKHLGVGDPQVAVLSSGKAIRNKLESELEEAL